MPRVAQFEITVSFLKTLLNLPPNVEVLGVQGDLRRATFTVLVEGPTLPEVTYVFEAPKCDPSFRRYTQEAAAFEKWNFRDEEYNDDKAT